MESLISSRRQSWLIWFYKGLLALALLILFGRLTELQIIKGAYYKGLAEGNRIRRIPIRAPRGRILARGGQELVGNVSPSTPSEEASVENLRIYDWGEGAAHLTGYLGEVNPDEVGKVDPNCQEKGPRTLGLLTGRSGLEEMYDCKLRGIDGEKLIEVDTQNKEVRVLGIRPPLNGSDLATTIDIDLQKFVSSLLDDQKGAILVTDPKGEVLALYSSPSYNPNIFIEEDQAKIAKALESEDLPLFNRATTGSYHPGSIFKIITSVAALEEGVIDDKYKYDDPGFIKVNEFSYSNWYFTQSGGVEGSIDLPRAISRSTDTFFYKAGELTGIDNLVNWAKKFNIGKVTGIDLPGEAEGLLPSPEWKKGVKGEAWFLGNTYHMAIGQGDLSVTPIQAHLVTQTIAAMGQMCKPHITHEFLTKNSECQDLKIDKKNLGLIIKGMIGACSQGGTAYPLFDFSPSVACKTGTAETYEKDITHAWFTTFAPAENPEIAITVLVEKGGEGSSVAAPIAKEILNYWFYGRNKNG